MLRLIIVILSLLATFMCIESGGAILDWLYSTKAYRIIYIIGETIADGTLTNMAFLVCALLCFCVSFRWLCFKKASFKRGVLWVALFSLIVQCDDTLFADIFLPCITYKHLWSLMLIILLGLDALKLLKSITKRSKAVKKRSPPTFRQKTVTYRRDRRRRSVRQGKRGRGAGVIRYGKHKHHRYYRCSRYRRMGDRKERVPELSWQGIPQKEYLSDIF